MEPWQGERWLYGGLGLFAAFGAATGLLEGPWSVATTGAPFAVLDSLHAHGHEALMVGMIAAHNLGVAATLPALGRFVASRTQVEARVRTLRVLFGFGLLAVGATAVLVPPTQAALPVFVLEGLAILALAVPSYQRLVRGRGALAPWFGLAAVLVVCAAAVEVTVV